MIPISDSAFDIIKHNTKFNGLVIIMSRSHCGRGHLRFLNEQLILGKIWLISAVASGLAESDFSHNMWFGTWSGLGVKFYANELYQVGTRNYLSFCLFLTIKSLDQRPFLEKPF